MKRFALVVMLLTALGMLTACGSSSDSVFGGGGGIGGSGSNAPIVGATVTVTDIDGNVLGSTTTGANGAFTLGTTIGTYPVIVTISSTPTSTFANGSPFKGELKGLFASGDPTASLQVTIPSSILYGIWDSMGRPSDITAARESAIALFQMLGMDTTSVEAGGTDIWSANPVGLNYEIMQQQLVFLCGEDDASGATDILSRATALGESFAKDPTNALNPASAGSVASLIKDATGYSVGTGGTDFTSFANLMASSTVKNSIATAVKQGLTGSSAASEASDTSSILNQIETQNTTASTSFGNNPAYIQVVGSGGCTIANTNLTQVIANGGTTTYAVTITGKQVDGDAPSASAFTISSLSTGLTASGNNVGAITAGTTTFSTSEVVTFTVDTATAGTYSATIKYTDNSKSITLTISFKVLASGASFASSVKLDSVARLQFSSTNASGIPAGSTTTTSSTASGSFTATGTGTFIGAFYLPDGMYFVDSSNRFWPNWDVVKTNVTGAQTVSLPDSKTIKANKDLSFGQFTWTFRVFDSTRSQLQGAATNSSIAYTSQAQTDKVVRQIIGNTYTLSGNATDAAKISYGTSGANLTLAGATSGNQYVTLNGVFKGAIQTWAMAAGDSSAPADITASKFYLNVKSSNFDDYTKTYGFSSSGNQNHDVTATVGAWSSTYNGVLFQIDLSSAAVNFYPDYGTGLPNVDKIRIAYDPDAGTHTATDVKSTGVTFSKN